MSGPFEGVRVLDLSRLGPGPYCSMVLGDLGADILQVEAPRRFIGGEGDLLGSGASADPDQERRLHAGRAMGRNKRSMVVNLREEAGREILYRLVADADVLLEGFRPGVMDRLGAGYDTISARNSRIVYCSLSGYGQTGPYKDMAGHDLNYLALSGFVSMVGRPGQKPAIPGNIVADFAGGGLMAALGIASALYARSVTGRGQHVDIGMSDGVMYLMAQFSGVLQGQPSPVPGRAPTSGLLPHYDVYECADGKYISIGSLEPQFWANLCEAMERPDFIERWQEIVRDPDGHPDVRDHFERMFKQRSRDEWFERLRSIDICIAPVYSVGEALADPHNRERMVTEVEVPGLGRIPTMGIGPKFSDTPGSIRTLAPEYGQHTDEVLEQLGYDGEQVSALRQAGVVE